jgi:hypothetical protein
VNFITPAMPVGPAGSWSLPCRLQLDLWLIYLNPRFLSQALGLSDISKVKVSWRVDIEM